MKNSAYIALAIGVLLATFFITQGISQNIDNPDLAGKYAAFIDEAIAKCRKKAEMLGSKSPNIRRQAFCACLKGAYLKVHKEELVSYLINVRAVPCCHRVQYHLNKQFYQAFKPKELYVLLEAGQMLNHSK